MSLCPYLVLFFFVVEEVGMLISMLSVMLLEVSFVGMIDLLPAQIAMHVSLFASNRALQRVKMDTRVLRSSVECDSKCVFETTTLHC